MTILPPSPFLNSVAPQSHAAETAVASLVPSQGEATAETNPPRAQEDVEEAPAVVVPSAAAAGATDYIPELFSVFAARRCLPIVSPPLQQCRRDFEPDLDALYDAIMPPEPPIFLRNPSQAFLRALFELSR